MIEVFGKFVISAYRHGPVARLVARVGPVQRSPGATLRTVPTGRARIARLLTMLLPAVLLAAGCSGQRPRLAAQVAIAPTLSQTRTPGGSTPPAPKSFTVVATGEMLIHPQLSAQAAADA